MERRPIVVPRPMHADGSACTCEPGCTCHPPTRKEDPITVAVRGSFHLKTCPAYKRVE